MRRAMRVATSEPSSVRTRWRQASMPAAVPALVMIGPVLDVEHVEVDVGAGAHLGQPGGIPPVGGAGAALEQAGRREREGAGAHRQDAAVAGDRLAQDLEDLRLEGSVDAAGRHRDEIGVPGGIEPVGGDDPDAARRAHDLARAARRRPGSRRPARRRRCGRCRRPRTARRARRRPRAPARRRRWCATCAPWCHECGRKSMRTDRSATGGGIVVCAELLPWTSSSLSPPSSPSSWPSGHTTVAPPACPARPSAPTSTSTTTSTACCTTHRPPPRRALTPTPLRRRTARTPACTRPAHKLAL